jgi:hypothetical protein
MKSMSEEVTELIKQEKTRADKAWPQYASKHEAYGVLAEEWREARDEISKSKHCVLYMLRILNKKDPNIFDRSVKSTREYMIKAICELIQCAAVCDRWLEGQKETTNPDTPLDPALGYRDY